MVKRREGFGLSLPSGPFPIILIMAGCILFLAGTFSGVYSGGVDSLTFGLIALGVAMMGAGWLLARARAGV
jgi:hypothetical protein